MSLNMEVLTWDPIPKYLERFYSKLRIKHQYIIQEKADVTILTQGRVSVISSLSPYSISSTWTTQHMFQQPPESGNIQKQCCCRKEIRRADAIHQEIEYLG